ncbi:MAG: hypothetical protein COX57_09205 [Alphaproteobacteria bacterium CG_4_10_14_0_2_um_filter_63_37]|nr:MAG: hypothetical protein AUJ55_09110 [Proteobacteria bacterium CG1_02_64_396]PJA24322.1 MAG: hypothetical protein COX57_09205 [Alphaproteobacteria bacterium CG_4_10_14_0_2_um_filter_63_37]
MTQPVAPPESNSSAPNPGIGEERVELYLLPLHPLEPGLSWSLAKREDQQIPDIEAGYTKVDRRLWQDFRNLEIGPAAAHLEGVLAHVEPGRSLSLRVPGAMGEAWAEAALREVLTNHRNATRYLLWRAVAATLFFMLLMVIVVPWVVTFTIGPLILIWMLLRRVALNHRAKKAIGRLIHSMESGSLAQTSDPMLARIQKILGGSPDRRTAYLAVVDMIDLEDGIADGRAPHDLEFLHHFYTLMFREGEAYQDFLQRARALLFSYVLELWAMVVEGAQALWSKVWGKSKGG